MSNPTVSFRISDYHLARGLRAIRHLEPNWRMTTISNLIRTLFNDYIAKSENLNNDPLQVNPELLQEIAIARTMGNKEQSEQFVRLAPLGMTKQQPMRKSVQQLQRDLEDEKLFNDLRREALAKLQREALAKNARQAQEEADIEDQINLAELNAKRTLPKPSEFQDPNHTESKISTVTDFSPPKDWIDQEV